MAFVYILKCSDGSFYTGWTNDLQKRLQAHNNGTASKYTRSRRPVEFVYIEKTDTKSAALKREAAIKKLTRLQKIALIKQSSDLCLQILSKLK